MHESDKAERELHPVLDSPRLVAVVALARRAALTPGTPVLIQGQPGTGAEELAAFIHERARGQEACPFVTVRCRGVAEAAIDAELLGGAGAAAGQGDGAIARAGAGTLFIDEVASLGANAQAALVAMLERPRRPRLIGGSSVDLRSAVRSRTFRSDLLDELSVLTLRLPVLGERPDDIVPLARRLVAARAGALGRPSKPLSPEACEKLLRHGWPGNCRELQSVVERALIVEDGATIEARSITFVDEDADFGQAVSLSEAFARITQQQGRPATLDELERAYVVWLLQRTHGNRTAASRLLGVSYPTIMKKIVDYKIDFTAPLPRRRG